MLNANNETLRRGLTCRLGGMPDCKARPRVPHPHSGASRSRLDVRACHINSPPNGSTSEIRSAPRLSLRGSFLKVHCETFQIVAALFGRHQNNAHKLKHGGGKLENDYGEEWR